MHEKNHQPQFCYLEGKANSITSWRRQESKSGNDHKQKKRDCGHVYWPLLTEDDVVGRRARFWVSGQAFPPLPQLGELAVSSRQQEFLGAVECEYYGLLSGR